MKLSRFLKEYFRKYVNVFIKNLRKYANLNKNSGAGCYSTHRNAPTQLKQPCYATELFN